MKRKTMDELVTAARKHGAAGTLWEHGGKHLKLHLTLDGVRSRYVTMSETASDYRALKNIERDIKRVIGELRT